MTVYVYGCSLQASNLEVRQLTIPQKTTGFHLNKQLLRNHINANYVLLYNNKKINENLSIYQQIPNFASITLCSLGKGGGNEDEENNSGMQLYMCLIRNVSNFVITDESIACGEDADMFYNTCQSSRWLTCNDLWH